MSAAEDPTIGEVREGYADVGDVRLHYVEAGEGPLVVLLHGFPEFWYGWREQIQPLAVAGSASSHPTCAATTCPRSRTACRLRHRPADRRHPGLIHERGAESAMLAGHDWGGSIAWATAMNHPEVVDRLAILNAAHPRKLSEGLHHPGQLRKSWYFFLRPPRPARNGRARRPLAFLPALPARRLPGLTPEERDRYLEAWSQPGGPPG